MSSESPAPSTLANVRATLKAALQPLLPSTWRIIDNLSAAEKLNVPALYFQFTGISDEDQGVRLPIGHVFCDFALSIITPQADTEKGENAADAAVLDLIHALDWEPNVAWSRATKTRQETGQLGWQLDVSVLSTSKPPAPPAAPPAAPATP